MSRTPINGTVVDTWNVTPRMRRLVVGGPEIADLRFPASALGPYVKLHLGQPCGRACLRTYSVRHLDEARGELHLDMILHGTGPVGSAFACGARVGDTLVLSGPGFIPATPCADYLLAGDHTAVPAVAHILSTRLPGCRVRAIIEVPDRSEEQPMPTVSDSTVTWLHRPEGAPSRLAETVELSWPEADDVLVWAGAERAIAGRLRRHARQVRDVPPQRCQVLNYWTVGRREGEFDYCQ